MELGLKNTVAQHVHCPMMRVQDFMVDLARSWKRHNEKKKHLTVMASMSFTKSQIDDILIQLRKENNIRDASTLRKRKGPLDLHCRRYGRWPLDLQQDPCPCTWIDRWIGSRPSLPNAHGLMKRQKYTWLPSMVSNFAKKYHITLRYSRLWTMVAHL